MKSLLGVILVGLFACQGVAVLAQTAQPAAAPDQAQTCRVCHGIDGVGTNPMIPNIGGQSPEYLAKQLQDFRAGRREDPQMTIIARDLTDEDIGILADCYGSIISTYQVPQ